MAGIQKLQYFALNSEFASRNVHLFWKINRIFSGKNNQIKSQCFLHGNSTEAEILIKPALKLNFGILEALASLELAMSVTHSLIMKVRLVTNQTGLHVHLGGLRCKNNQTCIYHRSQVWFISCRHGKV